MRPSRHSRQHFSTRHSQDEDDEELDAVVNPLGPPPAVGLTLDAGKTLSSIRFHASPLSKTPNVCAVEPCVSYNVLSPIS